MKNLYRSEDNKVFYGIMGGLGEYYSVDPVLLRAGYVAVTVITGLFPGALAYFICKFIIPKKPKYTASEAKTETK